MVTGLLIEHSWYLSWGFGDSASQNTAENTACFWQQKKKLRKVTTTKKRLKGSLGRTC